jgi:predicted MFS family arabinose efflux permease
LKESEQGRGLSYRWIIIAVSTAVVLGALGFARFGYTMILPSMKQGLGLSESQAGDLATSNMIGYLVLAVTSGLLASRFGPRIIITIFMLVTSLGMLATGLAPSFSWALLTCLVMGFGSAGSNVPVMGLVSAWFSAERRGLASGIVVSGSSFGLLITGLLIPAILRRYDNSGWRISWVFLAVLGALIAVLCWLFLRDRPSDSEPNPAQRSRSSPLQWGLIYKTPSIWLLGGIYVLFGFSYIIYATFFARYLVSEAGFTIETAGALWSTVGTLSIVSGFIWGSVSDLVGRKYGLAIVYLLQGLCYVLFGLWKAPAGPYVSALLFAVTAWSIPAIVAATAGDLLGARLAPAALGFITLFFGVGQAAGPFVAGRIAESSGSYTIAFVTAGIAAGLGAAVSIAALPARHSSMP